MEIQTALVHNIYVSISCTLFVLSCEYFMTIECAVGAPGYGSDLVYWLNAVDKYYLKIVMWSKNIKKKMKTLRESENMLSLEKICCNWLKNVPIY